MEKLGRFDIIQMPFLYVIVWCFLLSLFTGSSIRQTDEDTVVRKLTNHQGFHQKEVKRILIWEPFIHDNIAELENACLKTCEKRCEVTTDKTDIHNVDAVNFHLTDLWSKYWSIGTRSIINLPTYRRPDQVWIISNMEPPQHLWGDLDIFAGMFNWTRWYRNDADIHWTYGHSHSLDTKEGQVASELFQKRNFFHEKSKEVVGRISNCMDNNRRYITIKEMQKYLDIDMFGACYNKPCGENPKDETDKACDQILKQYKFYLAFENNDCRDYVTEKYWNSLSREQVPIVNWKSLDRKIVIPNSYINVYDFKDLKSLSAYVKKVGDNETLYNSYFEWKKSYKNWQHCSSCQICHALHDESRPAQIIEDLDSWVRNDICEKVGVSETVNKTQMFHLGEEDKYTCNTHYPCYTLCEY